MKRMVVAVALAMGLSFSVGACGGNKCEEVKKALVAAGVDGAAADALIKEKAPKEDQRDMACEQMMASPAALEALKMEATRAPKPE